MFGSDEEPWLRKIYLAVDFKLLLLTSLKSYIFSWYYFCHFADKKLVQSNNASYPRSFNENVACISEIHLTLSTNMMLLKYPIYGPSVFLVTSFRFDLNEITVLLGHKYTDQTNNYI